MEKPLGRGRILFAALPLELNDNLQAVGDVYRYALKVAGAAPVYTTTLKDPGILICPTRFPNATLYVITSESDQKRVDSPICAAANTSPGHSRMARQRLCSSAKTAS